MTDRDLEKALDRLTASVGDQRVEIAKIGERVGTLQTTHEANAVKLDRVLELELTCPSRAGWKATNARLKNLETGEKLRIESELQAARDEVTGQQDVESGRIDKIAPSRRWTDTRGTVVRALALKALPYVLLVGVLIGACLVSGGDEEATTRALRAVSDAITRVDSKVESLEEKIDTDAETEPEAVGSAARSAVGAAADVGTGHGAGYGAGYGE